MDMFKNKLGRPPAIHYLTPPPLAFLGGDVHVQKRSNVHVQSVSLVVNFGVSFLFSLIIFNYFRQIRFNFSFCKKTGEKKLPSTLDMVPSTLDMETSTLDPRPSTKRQTPKNSEWGRGEIVNGTSTSQFVFKSVINSF